MKILVLFIDMLRPNLLKTWNQQMSVSPLDEWMNSVGGKAFVRSYSPGPDTPRSQASVWSSRYPKFNGCNTRLKYPKYNLINPTNNFLRVLVDAGYKLNIHVTNSTKMVGELPEDFDGECVFSGEDSIETFLKRIVISDDSLTMILLDDFHFAVNDFLARQEAFSFGISKVMKCIKMIDAIVRLDSFDTVLLYSDHGFKMQDDQMNSHYDWIGEKRSNVFMFLHQKGDKGVTKDFKIRSVMDIGPTLCELAGVPITYQIDGKSLLDSDGSEFVVVSDHKNFDVGLSVPIVYWGIYTSKGFAAVDCELNWKADYQINENEKKELYDKISQYGDSFEENVLATRIIKYYQENAVAPITYFDGEPRKVHYTKKEIIKGKVKKVLKYITGKS
jgi:hypothetical protein